MKAYPLIYSRTKNEDFVPDFLVRPKDFEWKEALKFVGDAMKSLDTINDLRYSVFSVGEYCVYGGISCITTFLLEKVKKEFSNSKYISEDVEEYLKDCKGRRIAAFIGFAIKKSELRSGRIPDITFSQYWEIYLEYLKKQWISNSTRSEEIDLPPVDLKEKTYSSNHKPEIKQFGLKNAVLNFSDNPQDTIDYFFYNIIHEKINYSFISHIKHRIEWDNMNFSYAHVFNELLHSLEVNPVTQNIINNNSMSHSIGNDNNEKNTKRSYDYSNYQQSRNSIQNNNEPDSNDRFKNRFNKDFNQEKKKTTITPIILAAAVLLLIIIILIIK